MVIILGDLFKKLNENEVQIASYLLQGRVAPSFVTSEFNYSEKSILNVLGEYARVKTFDADFDLRKLSSEKGDIGLTIFEFQAKLDAQSANTGVGEVYEILWRIVNTVGSNSVQKKGEIFLAALGKMNPLESKFFARIVTGELRLGCSVKTLIDALSVSVAGDKSYSDRLNDAYGFSTDIGYLAKCVIGHATDITSLDNILSTKAVPGTPFFPRLVNRVGSFEEGFERIGVEGYIQPKYDGVRTQIHKGIDYSGVEYAVRVWSKYVVKVDSGNSSFDMFGSEPQTPPTGIEMFSRNLEPFTKMFPDVVESVAKLNCASCVLDCEVVGMRGGKFVPFQDTMTRRRKYDVGSAATDVPVFAFVFDILFLDGEDLTTKPLKDRLAILDKLIGKGVGNLRVAESIKNENLEILHKKFNEYVAEGLEGLILKKPDEPYIPNVRDYGWVKIKKSIDKELVDTVDLVVLGYYYGSGKQAKFGMGAILAGVYDADAGLYEPVTKIGTGITEEQWQTISEKLTQLKVDKRPALISEGAYQKPDSWVSPEIVVSVEADEISRSKSYAAGTKKLGYGLALRFPRLIDFGRDKLPEDATSVEELVNMYRMRKD